MFSRTSFALCFLASIGFLSNAQANNCYVLPDTLQVYECLQKQDVRVEQMLNATYNSLLTRMRAESETRANALRDYERAWIKTRDLKCKYALSSSDGGEQQGLGEIQCRINESFKQQIELEQISTAETRGVFLFELENAENRIEIRQNANLTTLKNPFHVAVHNAEFSRGMLEANNLPEVKNNQLRIKSLKTVTDNDTLCKTASVFLVELGYYAAPASKIVKIYVRSDVNHAKRRIVRIHSAIQTDLEKPFDTALCP